MLVQWPNIDHLLKVDLQMKPFPKLVKINILSVDCIVGGFHPSRFSGLISLVQM